MVFPKWLGFCAYKIKLKDSKEKNNMAVDNFLELILKPLWYMNNKKWDLTKKNKGTKEIGRDMLAHMQRLMLEMGGGRNFKQFITSNRI